MSAPMNNYQTIATIQHVENRFHQSSCVICHDDFTTDLEVTRAKCSHIFHKQCLEQWQNSDFPKCNQCPLCCEVILLNNNSSQPNATYKHIFNTTILIFHMGFSFFIIYNTTQELYQ